eukprot:5956223-Alexandrium_andersonii.AAC.1
MIGHSRGDSGSNSLPLSKDATAPEELQRAVRTAPCNGASGRSGPKLQGTGAQGSAASGISRSRPNASSAVTGKKL